MHAECALAPTGADTGREGLPPSPGEIPPAIDRFQPLPALSRGLPNTPIESCKALLCAVMYQAIQDQDLQWVASPKFTLYGALAGLELSEVFAIKRAVLDGIYKPRLYSNIGWLSYEQRV